MAINSLTDDKIEHIAQCIFDSACQKDINAAFIDTQESWLKSLDSNEIQEVMNDYFIDS